MTEEGQQPHHRGWRYEETVWTRDTLGNVIPISTGVTTDADGEQVAVMAHGNGPTCVIPVEREGDMNTGVSLNTVNAVAKLHELQKRQRSVR